MKTNKSITFLQYSGDFKEASERLSTGGKETYRGQRYTVEYVESLARRGYSVSVITGFSEGAHDVSLKSGVRAIGAGFDRTWDACKISELLSRTQPERIVLRTPLLRTLAHVARLSVPTLAMFADSLQGTMLKDRLKRRLTIHYLNKPVFEQIGNHGVSAAHQLIRAGVCEDKVRAWDYPAFDQPSLRDPKVAPTGRAVMYVGALTAAKGVDDLIAAAAFLKSSDAAVRLQLVGTGDTSRLEALVKRLELDDLVDFTGRVANEEVVDRMRAADLVVVPSRHEYSEGLPLTIYEAYCSRTPLIVSDHPMFVDNVKHEEAGLVFRAGDAHDLASQISRLLGDPALYQVLSTASNAAWQRIQVANTWAGMIDDWLKTSCWELND